MENTIISTEEFEAAVGEAESGTGTYTHEFRKHFEYMNRTFEKLSFDWDKLTGSDSLAIEREMADLGKSMISEEFSSEYLIRFAAKCCAEKIGSDAFEYMPLKDYKAIKDRARSFLLAAR